MSFSENLLNLRKSRGLKQQDLANQLEISLRVYQYYEHGEREPQLSTLVKLAEFYGLSLDQLVYGKE